MSLATQPRTLPPFRFEAIRELPTGMAAGLLVKHREAFADTVRFGPAWSETSQTSQCAGTWLAERIERAAHAEALAPQALRPVFVPAPDAALADPNAPLACSAAVARTPLLPQEFCLVFRDAASAVAGKLIENHVRAFRRRGFRVALDMRRSQATPLSQSLLLMIDTLRVQSDDLKTPDILEIIQAARQAGVCILADRPRWRDIDELASIGIGFGFDLRADA